MIKLYTHSDGDGCGCAVLAKLAFGENVKIAFCSNNSIDISIIKHFEENKNNEVHITDIRVNEEVAEMITASGCYYHLIDHHDAALTLNKYDWCEVRTHNADGQLTSGTELYYEWLTNKCLLQKTSALDRFVKVVSDYDTWRWVTLGDEGVISKQIDDLLQIYGKRAFVEWAIDEINSDIFPHLHETDISALNERQREIDAYIVDKERHMVVSELCGMSCGFVVANKHYNELGNTICKVHPEVDFVAVVDIRGRVSYRTQKDGIDLNNVAKKFNGGGHGKAAGSALTRELKDKLNGIGIVC